MRRFLALYRSTIGKKIMMAVSGIVLIGFVIGHMLGNLKAFQGADKLDGYAEFLREVGAPIFGHNQLLWLTRGVLLLAFAVHVIAALQLSRISRLARPDRYAKTMPSEESTYASRTMRWGGVFLGLFVVYHLLHFTVGTVHPDFVPGGVYHNVTVAFQSMAITIIYALAMLALGLHLYHGVWSGFQTLGLNHPQYNWYRRPLASVLALIVALGFVVVPLAIFAGFLD